MATSLHFVTLDVFTTDRFTGNPLAVVEIPQDAQVSTEQMQLIAREFNLSETVFLHHATTTTTTTDGRPEWRMRIFMTDAELPFAGHPTVGTACLALGRLGDDVAGTLMCNAGPIDVRYRAGVAAASIPHDVHVHTESRFTYLTFPDRILGTFCCLG
nr:putative isomerase [Quercus suber]